MEARAAEKMHRVLAHDGTRSSVRPLLLKGHGLMDDESRFLLQAGYIWENPNLKVMATRTRDCASGRFGPCFVSDELGIASVELLRGEARVGGRCIEPMTMNGERFAELLDAWHELEAEDRSGDGTGVEPLGYDLDEMWEEDYEPDWSGDVLAVIEAFARDERRYRLSDGQITTETSRWHDDRAARNRRRADEDARLLGQLADHRPKRGRPTPARVDALFALVRDRIVPAEYAAPFLQIGRVDDGAWAVFGALLQARDDGFFISRRWSLELRIDAKVTVLPTGIAASYGVASPVAEMRAVAAALLESDDWQVIHDHTLSVRDEDLREPRRRLVLRRPRDLHPLPWA